MILIGALITVPVAWLTFYIIKISEMTPTRVSSLVSLTAFIILSILSRFYVFEMNHYASLVFGASFVGMCSHKVINDLQVVIGGIIFSFLLIYLSPQSYGVGGALGFSAFTSILMVWLLFKVKKKHNNFTKKEIVY
jgi:hypothetical protein